MNINKSITALTVGVMLSISSITAQAGPVPHPSEYASYEQAYVRAYDVEEYWNSVNDASDSGRVLIENDIYGLVYVKDMGKSGEDSIGMSMFRNSVYDVLPSDWEVIFYLGADLKPKSVFAINHNNGMASVFKPGELTGDE